MGKQAHRIVIKRIRLGFSGIVANGNYADCHRALQPFGLKWGRGVLVRGDGYIEAILGDYGTSHSALKGQMSSGQTSCGTFYFGFDAATNTLYFDYASDRTFELADGAVLDAIMDALRNLSGPFRDFELERQA